jgi:hypothetical protein
MAYVAIGILFLIVLGIGITFLVMATTKNSSPAVAEDDRRSDAAPFSGPDHTPLGDTAQHAGQQDEQGRTYTENDASERGGTGQQTSGPHSAGHAPAQVTEEPEAGRFKREIIGGEGEGESAIEVGEPPHPERR